MFWAQRLDSLHQLQQIGYAKQRPTRSHSDVGVYPSGIGPIGWNGTQHTVSIVEPHPVFAPVLAAANQFEFLLKQRMVRVNHTERSVLNVAMRRICRHTRMPSRNVGCAQSKANAFPISFCLAKARCAAL